MNYSPCSTCAEKIIEFVSDPEWEMEVTIYFVQLYRARRVSCCRHRDQCFWKEDNMEGLRQLNEYVSLNNFTNTEWEDLATLLDHRTQHIQEINIIGGFERNRNYE